MREIKYKFVYKSSRSGIIRTTIHTLESIGTSRPTPFDPPIGYILLDRVEFTGLHDKNGKEIYEGDILRFELTEMGYIEIGIMEFVDSGFWMKSPNQKCHLPVEERREVIGNIWENPELLETK